jgi:hypothetical protein
MCENETKAKIKSWKWNESENKIWNSIFTKTLN